MLAAPCPSKLDVKGSIANASCRRSRPTKRSPHRCNHTRPGVAPTDPNRGPTLHNAWSPMQSATAPRSTFRDTTFAEFLRRGPAAIALLRRPQLSLARPAWLHFSELIRKESLRLRP